MTYRPPQRRVPVRIHTGSGWIAGSLHLPKAEGFVEFLAADGPYLCLTDVSLPGQRTAIPFFALRKAAVHLVEPTCAEWLVGVGPVDTALVERMVCCLLDAGTVTGRLELLPNLRVSDFVSQHQGFLTLRHAVIGPAHLPAPLLFINARSCVGVGDLGPQAPRPDSAGVAQEAELQPGGADAVPS